MLSGLIGSSGFVGGALTRQRHFDRLYNSRNIDGIAGEELDLVICAGAPATMWEANSRPEADAANLARLFNTLLSAKIARLVLISTVAVFDDVSAGYTETGAKFEQRKAYGRNRRELELRAIDNFDCCVMRLPALFGPGLKKNFIFDLMNPVPSFVAPAKFEELKGCFEPDARDLLTQAFTHEEGINMWKFHRQSYARNTAGGMRLEEAFRRAGFLARTFTNSESRYQFYNIERLSQDIDKCLQNRIRVLNICSEPLRAGDIHQEILGEPFDNTAPARVNEDVHSEFAGLFGQTGPYLFTRDAVLRELKAFTSLRETA
jgi:hypothetical protein